MKDGVVVKRGWSRSGVGELRLSWDAKLGILARAHPLFSGRWFLSAHGLVRGGHERDFRGLKEGFVSEKAIRDDVVHAFFYYYFHLNDLDRSWGWVVDRTKRKMVLWYVRRTQW